MRSAHRSAHALRQKIVKCLYVFCLHARPQILDKSPWLTPDNPEWPSLLWTKVHNFISTRCKGASPTYSLSLPCSSSPAGRLTTVYLQIPVGMPLCLLQPVSQPGACRCMCLRTAVVCVRLCACLCLTAAARAEKGLEIRPWSRKKRPAPATDADATTTDASPAKPKRAARKPKTAAAIPDATAAATAAASSRAIVKSVPAVGATPHRRLNPGIIPATPSCSDATDDSDTDASDADSGDAAKAVGCADAGGGDGGEDADAESALPPPGGVYVFEGESVRVPDAWPTKRRTRTETLRPELKAVIASVLDPRTTVVCKPGEIRYASIQACTRTRTCYYTRQTVDRGAGMRLHMRHMHLSCTFICMHMHTHRTRTAPASCTQPRPLLTDACSHMCFWAWVLWLLCLWRACFVCRSRLSTIPQPRP